MQKKRKIKQLETKLPAEEQIQTLEEKINQLQAENLSLNAILTRVTEELTLKVQQLEKRNAELSTQVKLLELEKKVIQKPVLKGIENIYPLVQLIFNQNLLFQNLTLWKLDWISEVPTMNVLWLNSFLVGNQIDSTRASAIAEYLKLNSSLTQLDLNGT